MIEPEISRIVDAALKRYAAMHPVPSTVTVGEAAGMLKLSPRTIHRMKPPRVGARIPYTWVLKKLEV
jgi:hypothetical protein